MVRRNRNHKSVLELAGVYVILSLRTRPGGYFINNDLQRRILWVVIAVNLLVILSILAVGGCRANAPEPPAIKEKPVTFEIIIAETVKTEDIKLMPADCGSVKVPAGAVIGDTVTVQDGWWISNQNYMRVQVVLMLFERQYQR